MGKKLAKEVETPAKTFEVYLKKVDILQTEYPLSINELKAAFLSLKTNKSQGHDQISFDVIKNYFRSSRTLCRLSLEEGVFQDN